MEKQLLMAQKRLKEMQQDFKTGDEVAVKVKRQESWKKVLTGTVIFSGAYFVTIKSQKSGCYSYLYTDMMAGNILLEKVAAKEERFAA